MGAFATAVQSRLRDAFVDRRPGFEWDTERRIASTPVDVAGRVPGRWVLVELEWRRADPADNTAKLFRHLAENALDGRIDVFQVFTRYYDLERGGISSKRANAEFVGRTAAATFDSFEYQPVEFPLDPPKRGGDRPEEWTEITDATARDILARL